MTEQERAELERLKAALRQVNENSGYGSDATFTTRLVFRAAVLRYWRADRDGTVYRLFEAFTELDGGAELPGSGAALPVSSVRQWMLSPQSSRRRCRMSPPRTRGSCAVPACAPSLGGTVSPRNMMLRTGRRSII